MFEGKRLQDHAKRTKAPEGLVARLELALEIARALPENLDDGYVRKVAQLDALLERIQDNIPKIEAWCVVKHYYEHKHVSSWQPVVWCAFLSKEQALEFAPAIAKAYNRPHRSDNDRWLVERRLANLSDFIAPTVSAKTYATEIRRYVDAFG